MQTTVHRVNPQGSERGERKAHPQLNGTHVVGSCGGPRSLLEQNDLEDSYLDSGFKGADFQADQGRGPYQPNAVHET